jgi:hypothetical protein
VQPPERPSTLRANGALEAARDGTPRPPGASHRPDLREVNTPWIDDLAAALWGLEGRERWRDREESHRKRRVDAGPTVAQTPVGTPEVPG